MSPLSKLNRWWFRRKLWWNRFRNTGMWINRSVDVQNVLLNAYAGRRPPLTREECKALAMYLGDPRIKKLEMPLQHQAQKEDDRG